jgi:hypothetical protein
MAQAYNTFYNMKIYLFNQVDGVKLDIIKAEMEYMGAPIIFYTSHKNNNFALHGSHRLWAAYEKGIRPFFTYVPYIENIHSDMSLLKYADYWRIFNSEITDGNCDFPICPPMKNIVNPDLYFFDNIYRPFLEFYDV